jgi:adenylate cyclase
VAEHGGEEHVAGVHTGTPDVFLSYASQDGAIAEAVCETLEQAGVTCWIAPRDVTPGRFYADEIVRAIDAAKAIVLILSQNAAASPHVLREIERATSKNHPVVSLRIDTASLPAGLEYFLNTSHWLDASGGGTASAMPKLVAALRLAIDRPPAADSAIAPRSTAGSPSRKSYPGSGGSSRRIAIVAGLALAVAIGGFAAYKLRQTNHHIFAPRAVAVTTSIPAASTAPTISEQSVAVLPFVDMSEKKDQEYFSDGLSEELIDMLVKVPDLRVPARTSSFYFKGKPTKIPEIAKELGVTHVLEGSVRKSGNHLRVTAQLVRADNGFHIWSQTYDRKLDDIFKVQDDIADAVVKALKVSLLAAQESRAPATRNMEAYSLLLRANFLLTKGGTDDDEEKAADYYQKAVQLDPASAPAWAGLSRGLAELTDTQSWKQIRQRVFDSANRAISLDPSLADAHIALGKSYFYDWDWGNAEAQFKQARTLEPTNFSVFLLSGRLAFALGHSREALQYLQQASARDPLNWIPFQDIGYRYESEGRFAEAEAAFRKAEQLAPTVKFAGMIGFMELREGRDSAAALAEINREQDEANRAYYLAASYALLGPRTDADAALARYQKEYATKFPYSMAELHAWRAEPNEALEWLERAYQQHDGGLRNIKTDTSFEKVKSDPRYKALLRKMNLQD